MFTKNSTKNKEKVICTNCSSENPSNYTTCVSCDSNILQQTKLEVKETGLNNFDPQFQMFSNEKLARCGQCYRINRADARFCDWCGLKVI